jgi:hypothetical protein
MYLFMYVCIYLFIITILHASLQIEAGHIQIVTKLEYKCHRIRYQNFVKII